MAQIEYGDFYKFVVSLGMALMALGALLLWLFLREPFDLFIESSKLAGLTVTARNLVLERQNFLASFLPFVPWLALLSAVAGAILTGLGLKNWRDRQVVKDKSEDLAVEKQKRELHDISPREVEENARVENQVEEEPESPAGPNAPEPQSSVRGYLEAETTLAKRMAECLGSSYAVRMNQRLGKVDYDAIIQPNSAATPDVIVETKYIRRGFHYGWLWEAVNRLAIAAQYYKGTLSRDASPVLIIILASAERPGAVEVRQLRERARRDLLQRGIEARIEYVAENALANMPCNEVIQLVLGRSYSQ